MILIDTGPLVALLDRNDPNHARVLAAAKRLPAERLLTTVPCLTEAMHFAGKESGTFGQAQLWQLIFSEKLAVHGHSPTKLARMQCLMVTYGDVPMDFADASLVSAAEQLGLVRILTLNWHFRAYRIGGTVSFDVLL